MARCSICLKRSRCGCGHDGVTPSRKANRKRGQGGEANIGNRKKPKRKANKYKPGALFESPIFRAPVARPQPHTSAPAAGSIDALDSFMSSCENIGDVLRAFGFLNNVNHAYRHLPSLAKRVDPQTWRSGEPDASVTFAKKVVCDIMQRVCDIFCENAAESSAAPMESLLRCREDEVNAASHDTMGLVAELYSNTSKGSTEKRVLRALACAGSRAGLRDLKQHVPGFTMSCDSFSAGQRDLILLKEGRRLSSSVRSLQRFEQRTVENAVTYILSAENVSFLSWRTKHIQLDGRVELFPAIQRKKSRTHIFEGYIQKSTSSDSSVQLLSRAAFFRSISVITAADARLKKAVDYMVGFLVNDSFELLNRIVFGLQAHDSVREAMLAKIETTCAYLKYGFGFRAKSADDSCLLHQITFGLDLISTLTEVASLCSDWHSAFQLFETFNKALLFDSADTSTPEVVDECRRKAVLFMGHRLRVINQQQEIAKVISGIRDRYVNNKFSSEAAVTLDFKMKLDPIYFREKTVEHYGKRGISWHGAMIQHWLFDDDVQVEAAPAAVEQKLYFDYISNGDSKQDREAVISITEAILIRIKKGLPHIKQVVLLSDNATCYQNILLPLITRLMHTKTHDGKGVLDSHFARSMQVLLSWVREGNNCITPTQSAIGLESHGGLPNSVIELVEHGRPMLQKLVEGVEKMEKQLRACMTRANDIQVSFTEAAPPVCRKGSTKYSQCPDFELKIFASSGVGDGVIVRCSPSRDECMAVVFTSDSTKNLDCEADTYGDDEEHNLDLEEDECFPGGSEGLDSTLQQEESESDDDEGKNGECQSEVIEMSVATGIVAGVQIATQGQIRRRTTRWRHTPCQRDRSQTDMNSRDVVSFAVRSAIQMDSAGELFVHDRASLFGRQTNSQAVVLSRPFNAGWAVRPRRGQLYGKRYIKNFREDIKSLYEEGERAQPEKWAQAGC